MSTWYDNYFNKMYYSDKGEVLCEINHPNELEEYIYINTITDEQKRNEKMKIFITNFINKIYKTETFYDDYWCGRIYDKFGLVFYSRTKGGRKLSKEYIAKKEDLRTKFKEFIKNNEEQKKRNENKKNENINGKKKKRRRVLKKGIVATTMSKNKNKISIFNKNKTVSINKKSTYRNRIVQKSKESKPSSYLKNYSSIKSRPVDSRPVDSRPVESGPVESRSIKLHSGYQNKFSNVIDKKSKKMHLLTNAERFSIEKKENTLKNITRTKISDIIPYSDKDYQFLRKKKKKMKKHWRKLQSQMMKLDEGLKKKKQILQSMEEKIESYEK